ncbi:unnamed protein product [Rotaria sordida]|uniref:Fatty acid hydroxylase domain-containing protein n=1 Tax=Rotaria sordida TaxID=392033 RepID=A0A819KGQ7_9BILA|nr:unnamed protein product [Rotaria sordida]CAF3947204.1 unnamed protein product [Rotaria sordida]
MSTPFLNVPTPRVDSTTGEKYYTSEDAMNLTPKQYEEWIYSSKTERVDEVRLYKTKFWNILLTKSPPFLPLLFWPFIIYYLITPLTFVRFFWILIGLILWFPFEYLFHRFLFHLPVIGYHSQKFHFFLHGIHHVAPNDLWHVFSPIHELGVQAFIVWTIFKIFQLPDPNALISGLLINYIRYDSVHYLIHAYSPTKISKIPFIGNYLRKCSIHHRQHHFSNPRKHFTISFISSFLD